jgi:hypothetical protein
MARGRSRHFCEPTSVKWGFSTASTVTLKADLERYAALHAQTYGEPVDSATLIPHMLESFMARDRGFRKTRAK